MTDHTDLIARLQSRTASMYLLEDVKLFHEAADALEALQAENAQWRVDFKEMVIARDAALARLAITEEANSMLLARNKWLEHTLEVAGASPAQPSQARELSDEEISKVAAPYGNSSIQGFDHIKAFASAIIAAINAKERT